MLMTLQEICVLIAHQNSSIFVTAIKNNVLNLDIYDSVFKTLQTNLYKQKAKITDFRLTLTKIHLSVNKKTILPNTQRIKHM